MADNQGAEDTLLTLTADIVAAHVSNNSVAVNDLPNLIQNVHSALSGISHAAAAPEYSGELIFPLEKWHNHSSSIVELPNGDLLVCWFHGSGERTADDVLIQAARWNKSRPPTIASFAIA